MAEKYSGTVERELRFRELELGYTPCRFEDLAYKLYFTRVGCEECLLRQHVVTVKDAVGVEVIVPAHAYHCQFEGSCKILHCFNFLLSTAIHFI